MTEVNVAFTVGFNADARLSCACTALTFTTAAAPATGTVGRADARFLAGNVGHYAWAKVCTVAKMAAGLEGGTFLVGVREIAVCRVARNSGNSGFFALNTLLWFRVL